MPLYDLFADGQPNPRTHVLADPVQALDATWQVYAPQQEAYITRALDPRAAPSFGVPGNL